MAGDTEMIAFLKRALDYCLTGDASEEVVFFLYGLGQNGKGVLTSLVEWLLADYCVTANEEVFLETRFERHSTEIARLAGARVVLVTEVEAGKRWAESRLKAMTGGDTITARFMRQDNFEFKPKFKPVVVGNRRPQLKSVDFAMRRRMHLVPFNVTIAPEKRDTGLKATLKAEGPGILSWLIEGCLEFQMIGLAPSRSVVDATNEYFTAEDNVASWIAERCDKGPNLKNASSELFASWKEYGETNRLFIGDARKFKEDMRRLGYENKSTKAANVFVELRLRAMFKPLRTRD
jgi:putative DNA primase/helicase